MKGEEMPQPSPDASASDALKGQDLVVRRLAKAIQHPLRVEIFVEVDRAPMSPNEFSQRSGYPLSTVAYHFRELKKLGCVEVVEEVQRRGSNEHFYAVTTRNLFTADGLAALPVSLRNGVSATTLSCFMDRTREALEARTFDSRGNRHLTWTPLKLDEEGFDRVMSKLDEVFELLGAEQLAAEQRLAKSDEEPVFTTVGLIGFESPAPDRNHTPG